MPRRSDKLRDQIKSAGRSPRLEETLFPKNPGEEQDARLYSPLLRCVDEEIVESLVAFFLVLVGNLLALDAERRPRHCIQALGADVLLTVEADSIGSVINAMQSCTDVAEQVGLAVQVADGQLALGGVLYFVQGVRTFFDRDPITISQHLRQFGQLGFEDFFVLVHFGLRHWVVSYL